MCWPGTYLSTYSATEWEAATASDTFKAWLLGQGKDIGGGELVPDVPRVRRAEISLFVDLGSMPARSTRHDIAIVRSDGDEGLGRRARDVAEEWQRRAKCSRYHVWR